MGRRQGFVLVGVLAGMLCLVEAVGADDPMAELERRRAEAADKRLLQAGIGLDGDSLVEFLRARPAAPVDPERIQPLIRQLESEDFQKREQATRELMEAGQTALPGLEKALDSRDAEVVRRARACIQQIERRARWQRADWQVYAAAERQLVRLRPAGVVPKLLDNLDNPNPLARRWSESILNDLVGPEHLADVVKAIKDKRPLVRVGAIGLSYKFKDQPKVFAPLMLKALRDENVLARRQAAMFMRHFGSEEGVVPALITALNDKDVTMTESESSVAQGAASSLGDLGSRARPAIPVLMELSRTGNERLRYSTIHTLGILGKGDKSVIPTVVPFLVQIFEDGTQTMQNRGMAAHSLGLIGPDAKGAVPALRRTLKVVDTSDPKFGGPIRAAALSALRGIGPGAEAAVPDLTAILQDKNEHPWARERATAALGNIGPAARSAIPALTEAMKDEELKEAAARALEQLHR